MEIEESKESSNVVVQASVSTPQGPEANNTPPDFLLFGFDLEATGLKIYCAPTDRDQITQFGFGVAAVWVNRKTGRPIVKYLPTLDEFLTEEGQPKRQCFVKPTKQISAKVEAITGITAAKLAHAPPLIVVLPQVESYIDTIGAWYDNDDERIQVPRHLMAQNADYDVAMLIAELERVGLSALKWFKQRRFELCIDTLPLCRDVVDSTLLPIAADGRAIYTLSNCYKATTGKQLDAAHTADADASGLLELILHYDRFYLPLFKDMQKEAPKYTCSLIESVQRILKKLPKQAMGDIKTGQPQKKKTKTLFDMGFTKKEQVA